MVHCVVTSAADVTCVCVCSSSERWPTETTGVLFLQMHLGGEV